MCGNSRCEVKLLLGKLRILLHGEMLLGKLLLGKLRILLHGEMVLGKLLLGKLVTGEVSGWGN